MRPDRVRQYRWICSLVCALLASAVVHAAAPPPVRLEVAGVRVGVTEVASSVQFYTNSLGFDLIEQDPGSAILRNGPLVLGLRKADHVSRLHYPEDAEAYVVFRVMNLKTVLQDLIKEGGNAAVETRSVPTDKGNFLTIKDLSGNVQQILEPNPRDNSLIRPEVLHLVVAVTDLKQARDFYCGRLGFQPASEGLNPPSVTLTKAGAASIVLKETAARKSRADYPRGAQTVLLLATEDLAAGMAALKKKGIEFLGPPRDSPLGRHAAFRDPFGNVLELLQENRARTAAKPAAKPDRTKGGITFEPIVLTTPDGRKVDAELGRLTVAENREKPAGKSVELAFVRLKSTASKPGPPIVYLAGGPGGSGVAEAKGNSLPLFLALRELGDVIALDQRGTGLSRPELTCLGAWFSPLNRPSDPQQILTDAKERSATCTRKLRDAGIDLASYNTNESADDLEDLRQALGAPKIRLLALSYGTHLALAAIRRHEGSLQSAVLAGVEGPDQMLRLPGTLEKQLEGIGQLIKADPEVGAALPALPATLRSLLSRLEEQPVTVEVDNPLNNRKAQVTVGKFDLQWMTAQALSNREGIRKLPAKILALRKGDFRPLGEFAIAARRGWLGSALPYAMQCASGASPERLERIRREEPQALLGEAMDFPFPQICEAWGVPDLGPAFRAPVHSNLPALFISGSLDTRAPAGDGEEVRKNFPHGAHLSIEGAGHGDDLLLSSPEIGRIVLRFLSGQAVTDTRIALAPLKFEPAGAAP
jgi:pimeloyl-ACP methyl ester carboxylesterase/catechol 2,3-dioxygenase-like lactoylglutathione lyase family enzyme